MTALETALPAELTLRSTEFRVLADLLHAHSGILLADSKLNLMAGRLTKRLRALGLSDFRSYADLVRTNADERAGMIEALTTNHTSFFRERHHFTHLSDEVLPRLLTQAKAGRRVRIWSAGCSSGEEPYTIAICVAEAAREVSSIDWLGGADVRILATDLATHVLRTAAAGRYPASGAESLPREALSRWTRTIDDELVMSPQLRSLIAFKQLNLLNAWPMGGPFDIIFCRNVMIYFDEPTKARLCERFVELLAPGGMLYIGHSERVCGSAADQLEVIGQTSYRKVA